MTYKEMIERIAYIARRSTSFKIGETGLTKEKRLSLYNKEYKFIETICWSTNREKIDALEDRMIRKFRSWKNCDNQNTGSACEMNPNAEKFILYVVYNLKKRKK